jgi:phospholipid/cholesterol/gamma-HCH transport system substrate-binding protein
MENHSTQYKIRLGLFVVIGLALFMLAIFLIGKQKNLFDPVFKLTSTFRNVSGLQVGNSVRFSGINVGTVDNILIINDSTVKVDLLIKNDVKKFIKTDCQASIGSEGLIGDKLVVISQGQNTNKEVKEGQMLKSSEPVETDAIIASLQVTAENFEVISDNLAQVMVKINSGKGTLGRLIQDTTIAQNLNQTIVNLKKGTKGLDENMEAAKHNFLLKGYFKKKAKEAEKKKEAAAEKREEDNKK